MVNPLMVEISAANLRTVKIDTPFLGADTDEITGDYELPGIPAEPRCTSDN